MSVRLLEAAKFATIKHDGQYRKNSTGDPYIVHPIEVCQHLINSGVTDEDVLIAGLLHDTLEDTNTTEADIANRFGKRVLDIVKECTDDKGLSKIDRKKKQIDKVQRASVEGRLVKLADKLSNVRGLVCDPPKNWSKEEIYGYALWCKFVSDATNLDCPLRTTLNETFQYFDFDRVPEKLDSNLEQYYDNILNSE